MNNKTLPRFRLSDMDHMMKVFEFERMTKRELLKQVFNAWRKISSPQPRGWRMIEFVQAKPKLEGFFEIVADVIASTKAGRPMSERAIAGRLRQI